MSEVTVDHDDGHSSIAELAQQAVQLHRDRFGSRPTAIVLTRAQYQRLSQEMAERMSAPNPTILMLASVPVKVSG